MAEEFYIDSMRRRMLPMSLGASSPGGVLTQNVQSAPALPLSMQRRRERDALLAQEDDMSALQAYGRQQGESGQAAMLNALAAQFAGERFEPVQTQFLKRAAAAQQPMRVGKGMVTPDGQYIVDPGAKREAQIARLSGEIELAERLEASEKAQAERLAEQRRAQQALIDARREADEREARLRRELRAMGQSGPQRAPQGYQWTTTADGQPALTFIPGGPADPSNKNTGPASEDERKAGAWFAQASNARNNMESIVRTAPSAAYPSVAERAAGFIPGVGADIANALRPENRQKFVQAAESMSEALLRAATGAGVTKDETNQKLRELVPQLGDKPGTVQQKLAAYDVYMGALRTRAGRALPTGGSPTPAPAQDDPLGLRR
jgi:hypothetical protein